MPSKSVTRASLDAGRANQKLRTYQTLLETALALTDAGQTPTLQDVAGKAGVSRATVYRYFASVDALIHEAYFGRAAVPLEAFVAPGTDPAEAIGRAAEVMNGLLLDDEAGLHVVERAFMQMWIDSRPGERPSRVGRRMKYIDPIVNELSDRLDAPARRRLRTALALTLGTEAVLAMRDVAGASAEECIAASAWAAQALVRQAIADAAAKRGRQARKLAKP